MNQSRIVESMPNNVLQLSAAIARPSVAGASADVLAPPPPPASAAGAVASVAMAACDEAVPTKGSMYHGTGRCKPCAFVFTRGCQNGYECPFCHLCDPGEKKR